MIKTKTIFDYLNTLENDEVQAERIDILYNETVEIIDVGFHVLFGSLPDTSDKELDIHVSLSNTYIVETDKWTNSISLRHYTRKRNGGGIGGYQNYTDNDIAFIKEKMNFLYDKLGFSSVNKKDKESESITSERVTANEGRKSLVGEYIAWRLHRSTDLPFEPIYSLIDSLDFIKTYKNRKELPQLVEILRSANDLEHLDEYLELSLSF